MIRYMHKQYDTDRLFECMFDTDMIPALAELEQGPQDAAHLAKLAGIDTSSLHDKLAYMTECGFLTLENDTYTADHQKLSEVLEKDGSFSHIIDGVTEMDSYLN